MADRAAVLVFGPGTVWAGRLSSWSAAHAADLVWCATVEEVWARLRATRRFAALVAEGRAPGLDRDLIAEAARRGTRTIVVDDRADRRWTGLGARAVLAPSFDADELGAAIDDAHAARPEDAVAGEPGRRGHLVVVCGSGGTGASTIAVALAQGLGASGNRVLLADFARHGEQAMLHDVSATGGIEDVVEAHRTRVVAPEDLAAFVHHVDARGYDLLVGLRRARAWSLLRPRAVEAALATLRGAYDVIVCDVDPDLEGEDDGGSLDVEERNVLARVAVAAATVTVVVAAPGLKGTHSLVRVLGEVWSHGGDPSRTAVVLNRSPNAGALAVVSRALERLVPDPQIDELLPAVALPDFAVEEAFVTGVPLDSALVLPITRVVSRSLGGEAVGPGVATPTRVTPGSLGTWHQFEDD